MRFVITKEPEKEIKIRAVVIALEDNRGLYINLQDLKHWLRDWKSKNNPTIVKNTIQQLLNRLSEQEEVFTK